MARLVIASASYGRYAEEALRRLEEYFGDYRRVVWRSDTSESEIIGELQGVQALVLGGTGNVTRRVLEKASELYIIARHGIGLDNVDLKAATEMGIVVTYCRHTGEEVSVAEHTLAPVSYTHLTLPTN